jgi:SAM-dependent methyltransferase
MKPFKYFTYNFFVFFKMNLSKFLSSTGWYFSDLSKYRNGQKNKHSSASFSDLTPYLADKTEITPLEPIYFLQDIWLAGKVFGLKPLKHFDIGSSVKTVAIISKGIPTTFVDIRPPDIKVEGLNYLKGSVLKLPFKNKSLESISSICVLEHIGLGRYGDKIDPWGSEKAILEITRVLKSGGNLFVSVPVDIQDKAFFNAHRTFTRNYFLSLFATGFDLKEEKYIYGKEFFNKYDQKKGFGTGLYYFKKK